MDPLRLLTGSWHMLCAATPIELVGWTDVGDHSHICVPIRDISCTTLVDTWSSATIVQSHPS